MKWWLFFPALYFAIAADLICSDWLQWRGTSADAMIWLWSVAAMRTEIRRSVPQAALLGLLRDLAVGTPLGLSAMALISLTWFFGTFFRTDKTERRLWPLWALPLIFLGFVSIHAVDCYLAGVHVRPLNVLKVVAWPSLTTYLFGCFLGILIVALSRLTLARSLVNKEQLEPSSFFLSR